MPNIRDLQTKMPAHARVRASNSTPSSIAPRSSRKGAYSAHQQLPTSDSEQDEEDAEETERVVKRPRMSDRTDETSTEGEGDMITKSAARSMAERDPKDGFIPGSIIKVELENFVTYDHVSFSPGPHLNMIIGPNGTGKSTIACAICLGLGWPPSLLGRAPKISSFVKQGAMNGCISLTLKNKIGEEPLVLKRKITSTNDSSQWSLNGRNCNKEFIQETVEALNVQVSNLCTFLPQDRVCEFAAMSAQQLLVETQRCAGDAKLTEWHERLIEDAKKENMFREEVEKLEKDLAREEEANKRIENEVAKFEERERLEKELRYSQLLLPFAKYQGQKEVADVLKKKRENLAAQVLKLKERFKPFDKECTQLQEVVKRKKNEVAHANEDMTRLHTTFNKFKADLNKVDGELSNVRGQMDTIKTNEERAKKDITEVQRQIKNLEKIVSQRPERPDTTNFREMEESLFRKMRAIKAEIEKIDDEKRDHMENYNGAKSKISNAERMLEGLQDARKQKDSQCQTADPNLWQAVTWIRENEGRFKGVVPEPIRLAVKIKEKYRNNPRVITMVESIFGPPNLRTFICTEKDDYLLLTEELNKKRNLRVNLVELPKQQRDLSSKVPLDQLQNYGLDVYVSDLLEAPDEIMRYMMMTMNIQNKPVAFKHSQEVNTDLIDSRLFRSYLTYDTAFEISKSRYGVGETITTAKTLQAAKDSWLRTTDNEDQRRQWENERDVWIRRREQAKVSLEQLQSKKDQLKEQQEPLETQRSEITQEKEKVTKVYNDWNAASHNLVAKNKTLVKLMDRPNVEKEREKLNAKLFEICEGRKQKALLLKTTLISIMDATARAQVLALESLQAEANAANLQAQIDTKRSILLDKEEEFDKAKKEHKELTTECKDLLAVARQMMEEVDDDLREKFHETHMNQRDKVPVPKVEDVEEMIRQQKTQLEMTEEVSTDVRDQYQSRKTKIKHLKQQHEACSIRLHNISKSVQITRSRWYPALQGLVQGISKKFDLAFARMGCQGEVQIAEDPDYSKWGIKIMVSFRDGDKMQPLTGQRQSGGERSLSTILYLMSLTELSKSPFSLVDEINQGMDQRAERAVHNQLVEVTCKDEAGQYFLITPKLLPDLRYHKLMKILCINNGEWLPQEKITLKQIVAAKKR